MKARFIYQDEKSHKFWDIETNGTDLTVQYGKVGTTGQSQTKQFASEEECKKAADKLIAEKTKKGYVALPPAEKLVIPVELYENLLAVADYVEQNYPDVKPEITPVNEDNISAMEDCIDFEMPSDYVDYWLEKGNFSFVKGPFICDVYAFTDEFEQANNLYNTFKFFEGHYKLQFDLLEREKDYFMQCFWVLGQVGDDDETRVYVGDPSGHVHMIHFSKGFGHTDKEGFEAAMAEIMRIRPQFSMMIVKSAGLFDIETPSSAPAAETQVSKALQDGFRKVSYDEVLQLLGVDQLFDFWDDEDNSYSYNYESEREYFEENIEEKGFLYHDGDLHLDRELSTGGFIIVRGDLNIQGELPSEYYVTGNTTADYLALGYLQKTLGKETIRYVALATAEDHEVLRTLPHRELDVPYFFSWFFDLNSFTFPPETVITALYNYDDLITYQTDALLLAWHEYAYVFRPEFCYQIEESWHDSMDINYTAIYEAVKAGKHPFLDGVTAEGIRLVKKGAALKEENDLIGAYQAYKEAISKSPGYYPAYSAAGKLLYSKKAYGQAMQLYAKGIPLTPEHVLYEFECLQKGGISAIRMGAYDQAIEWAQIGIARKKDTHFYLRIIAEALIYMGELEEAKTYLERSIDIEGFFSNYWLLGLVFFLQGDTETADTWYQQALSANDKARPYTEHKDLSYIFGEPVTVDWDTKKPVSTEKGQEYWDNFLTETLKTYGPDLYERVGQSPSQWIYAKISKIPPAFRSTEMMHALLDHRTKGQLDVTGSIIAFFDAASLTEEIVFHAVQRAEPAEYKEIPARFFSEKLLRIHPEGINLTVLPADQLNYALCFDAVSQNQHSYQAVPKEFQDERMNIALIAGGILGDYPYKELPSKYSSNEYIKQAVETHILAITNLRAGLVDKEIYAHAAEKYGNDPMWPFIVERYDTDAWKYGSLSSIERMGETVRKFGIDAFDHVNAKYVGKQDYDYFKKHLGHLPAFAEKAIAYGWDKNKNKVDEYDKRKEFDYDTFRKVWACFWTEDYIIKALDKNEDKEHLYNLPDKYKTQRICDIAVKRDSYDFAHVPAQFITKEMCMQACSTNYGTALEYVPLEMRTREICDAAIARSAENIKFVPLPLRTVETCGSALARENNLTNYIPHAIYTAVFEWCFKNRKNRFSNDYLMMHWGLGLIIDKNYEAAREKLSAVTPVNSYEYHHQAVYYIGWSYFLEGDVKTAKEYFTQSQEIAKTAGIDGSYKLTFPYASFQLLPVHEIYPFNKESFDEQMKETSALVQTGFYDEALALLEKLEKMLTESNCTEMRWWAYVWDHQRYALYEAGREEASYEVCHRIINELGKVTMWDYLEEFNILRATLRAANNNLAYRYYLTATDLAGVKEGLNHIKTTMKTIAPIEDKSVLNGFYETQALLLYKAMGFDPAYRKDLEKVVAKIEKLKQKEEIELSDEFEKIKL
ncbi:WGR domain-containing protein, predicted DNA-binding domain in MolR [Chitinophaga sp. YR627]|uniref:WGR domain-containing protein n=1 Tax=Chitinophaga sp. YR627 TaxID=1881041 RepID=UPI0008EDCA3F|nr:WGR domain-containing protein [Chitinophaga sp. YR627]SFM86827.1 WGR domain-containing protein, predicted DNA-binding domain in MolR [Chitinophaga sp. YR627]